MLIREVWSILLVLCSIGRSEDNVALNKTAEQSSDLFVDKWLANKAVDGCENTNVYSDCCTHTGPNTEEAWWRVDLGELMTVNQITIYYRDPFQYRFAGYYLYLSNTTDSPIDGVLCYKDQSRNRADVQLVVTHECPYVARYVTVYNYRNDTKRHSWYSDESFLELCEVQVYGCPIGMYGDGDCNSRCSAACNGGI
ncbi:fucolectin-4-like isoform X2 [Argopecten irradians]|uniref:fucolectin-4-like isoform X2 n=1 Tax=Argopecten irradians TaxID=31199 RepID=UPI00371AD35A